MKNSTLTTFILVLGVMAMSGTAIAETQERVCPPGAAEMALPSAPAFELIREARQLSIEINELRSLAMRDTSLRAFGSALERYTLVRDSLVKQLVLLEEAIDVADNSRLRIQAIKEYDRVEREVAEAKRFLAILDVK
jgi:hypothetical protein